MSLRKVGKILLYTVAGILGTTLLLLLAVSLALDRAPQYQTEIKKWVHDRSGYPVEFAHVVPKLQWYGPELYFDRPELRSKDGRQIVAHALGGRIGVDVWQCLRHGKLFAARIQIDSPEIVVRHLANGRFAVASEVLFEGTKSPLPAVQLNALPFGTLDIRHGRVTLQDWNAALPELQVIEVDLRLSRDAGAVQLDANAALPGVLGGIVDVRGKATGADRLDNLKWSLSGHLQALSFAGWRSLLPNALMRLESGTGGFGWSARGQGSVLSGATLDLDARVVTVQLADEPPAHFEQIAAKLALTGSGDRWRLSARRVRALRDGRRDPDSDLDVAWQNADGGLDLQATATYLRADALLPLAGLLPQKELRERVLSTAPSGEWTDLRVAVHRAAPDGAPTFNFQARFRGAGFAPAGRAPGLRGLDGTLAGDQSGGRVDLETRAGILAWPAELQAPLELEYFKTTLFWRREPQELLVATPSFEIRTPDAALHGRAAWLQPTDGSSPSLTLAASVDDGNVANARRYLPKSRLPASAFAWLNRALVAGRMAHADVVMQGPIRQYPFRDGSGLFSARLRLEGVTLEYKEGWPDAENLAGTAEFRNEGMTMHLTSGRLGQLSLESGNAHFADLKTGELELHTVVRGDAGDALGYLRATPLDAAADHMFSSVEAQGPITANVNLFLPLKAFEKRRTQVTTRLAGVSINRIGSSLTATALAGEATIDGSQMTQADVRGEMLGGVFQMTTRATRSRAPKRTTLVFNGTLSGEALHAALGLPAIMQMTGTTDWHGVLRTASEPTRERSLRLNASLSGLDLNLPEPLAKPAGRALPTSVAIEWPAGAGEQVRIALGSVLRARFSLEVGANGPVLGRAAVAFGAGPGASGDSPPFSDTQQLTVGGSIDRLDLAGWLRMYAPDKNARPLGNFLRTAQFEVAQLDYLGLSFKDIVLNLAATDSGWHVGIGGPNVVGSVSMPGAADSVEPWRLEFQRLKFVDGPASPSVANVNEAAGIAAAGAAGANPRSVPALEFHAAELIWDDRHMGDVQATLKKLDDGISVQQLQITARDFSATAKGEWRGPGIGIARIQGVLSSRDVGATMKELGYGAVIEGKSGSVDVDLSWAGAPTAPALAEATGHVKVVFDNGQITGISPGAGRVLGLTSLGALPRRLALDFSDLTDKGFAFDTIRGDFDLHGGSAHTDNLIVKGPAADIGLAGRVGLKNRDYDQTVAVTGNVSSTLPLAAFMAGPVVGGAVLLFTQVFKEPLNGLVRGYYRITGSWDNPVVERITSADAAAATAEAAK